MSLSRIEPNDTFLHRHLGPDAAETAAMLDALGLSSLAELVDETVPEGIRLERPLALEGLSERPLGEHELSERLRRMVGENQVFRSYIGLGYHDCILPPVIRRNILENPSWYTQYTPYQSEISQGRLEMLLNFQTVVADLTALPVANASLLDEATAAAEAMAMTLAIGRRRTAFFAAADCHPQTLAVLETRAESLGIDLRIGEPEAVDVEDPALAGVLLQYPASDGRVGDHAALIQRANEAGVVVVMACDLLALTLLRPPGELGAGIAIGSAQRFGVPLGYGGPHAAFLATRDEHKRQLPGRIIGLSRDVRGKPALRMALQTREQHIRRQKATSNICTAQVLLAIIAAAYAVYHGPDGLRAIARRVRTLTLSLAAGLRRLGYDLGDEVVFDTLHLHPDATTTGRLRGLSTTRRINLRHDEGGGVGISLDETTTAADVDELLGIFAAAADRERAAGGTAYELAEGVEADLPSPHARTSGFLDHPVFHEHRTEHEMLRYLHRLAARDLSLTTSMIALGSCTMKLNATTEMQPITWPEIARLHPFAPVDQAAGYRRLFALLESWLSEITGFDAVSLQPNAGAQGEYAGLLVIRAYHRARGDESRDVCLIPVSAHGTNPASAVMAGLRVVPVACDERGNVDVGDLRAKAEEHGERLAALMVTYPSTHGVFEEAIVEICDVIHHHGGQVYLDGANLNAQVGLCRPGDYGADVCHLNLHKTFCIPHGGGGPGMGPIAARAHLAPFLPGHPLVEVGGEQAIGAVAAAPWGSASILPISWVYIALMGAAGLTRASEIAILSANYLAARLGEAYPVLYRGARGRVAHELILDLRPFQKSAGIDAEDVAKRLMDYGFHAPTMSFPVAGTLMIEPTESESKAELDRFVDAMLRIRAEIRAIEDGAADRADNPLKNAPHTADMAVADAWTHPYSRETAVFPAPWLREHKFWPAVARVENAFGDRNLICSCPPVEDFVED